MNRGEVYWVNFDPQLGSEIQKRRPAVVLSRLNRPDEAWAALDAVLMQRNDFVPALKLKGMLLEATERGAEAARVYALLPGATPVTKP